jgi:hypothetical protein
MCSVCFSPTWKDQACILQLWAENLKPEAPEDIAVLYGRELPPPPDSDESPAWVDYDYEPWPRNYAGPPTQVLTYERIEKMSVDEKVEHAIDFMESIGMTLVPWQAEVLRRLFAMPTPKPARVSLDSRRTLAHRVVLTDENLTDKPNVLNQIQRRWWEGGGNAGVQNPSA